MVLSADNLPDFLCFHVIETVIRGGWQAEILSQMDFDYIVNGGFKDVDFCGG